MMKRKSLTVFTKLSVRLALILFCIATLPVALVSGVLYHERLRDIHAGASAHLALMRDLRVTRIDAWLAEKKSDLQFLANFTQNISKLAMNTNQDAFVQACFGDYLNAHSDTKRLLVFDGDSGAVRFSSTPEVPVDDDCTQRKAFLSAKQKGCFHVTDAVFSQRAQTWCMSLAYPVFQVHGPDKTLPMVIVLEVAIAGWQQHVFDPIGLVNSDEIVIVDSALRSLNGNHLEAHQQSRLRMDSLFPAARKVKTPTCGVMKGVDYKNVPVLAAYRILPETGWMVVAKRDLADIYHEGRLVLLWALWRTPLILIALGLLAWLVAQHVIKPLVKIRDVTTAFGQGHMHVRNNMVRSDEIGEVALAFDRTADKLVELTQTLRQERDNLEKTVADRTAEIHLQAVAMDHAVGGIMITDDRGCIVYVNDAFLKIKGCQAVDIMGRRVRDLIHDPRIGAVFETCAAKLLCGEPWHGTYQNVRFDDGTVYWEDTQVSFVRDASGRITYYVAWIQNITKEVEQRDALHRMATAFAQTIAGVVIRDMDGRVVDVNDAYLRMTGFTRDALIGRCEYEHWDVNETRRQTLREAHDAVVSGGAWSKVYADFHQDGTVYYVHNISSPILNDQGIPLYHLSICQDVTGEMQMRNEMRRLVQIVEQSEEGIQILDEHFRVEYCNPAFYAIAGTCSSLVIGKRTPHYSGCLFSDEQFADAIATVNNNQRWHQEVSGSHGDGQLFAVKIAMSPIVSAKTQAHYYVVTMRDVLREKELEKQVQHAQKMESVGRLAGGIAHDFNNILQGILGFAELIEADTRNKDAHVHEGIVTIQRAAERARELTRQLLAFGSRQLVQMRALNINGQVTSVEKLLSRTLGEGVHIRTHLDPALNLIMADPTQIDQVIMNVVLNARDAMVTRTHAPIDIVTRNQTVTEAQQQVNALFRPGDYVCLSISDTGVGIPENNIPYIFEPFFTTKEIGKGTGLGLSVVYGIVKQHNGWVDVDSVVGVGTTLNIYFPVYQKTGKSRCCALLCDVPDAAVKEKASRSFRCLRRGICKG